MRQEEVEINVHEVHHKANSVLCCFVVHKGVNVSATDFGELRRRKGTKTITFLPVKNDIPKSDDVGMRFRDMESEVPENFDLAENSFRKLHRKMHESVRDALPQHTRSVKCREYLRHTRPCSWVRY